MKSLKSLAAFAVITAATLTPTAFAAEGEYVTFPNPVRCQACGAQYHVIAKVTPKNALELKLEQINKTVNPKTR